jgi:hypothetical protein
LSPAQARRRNERIEAEVFLIARRDLSHGKFPRRIETEFFFDCKKRLKVSKKK